MPSPVSRTSTRTASGSAATATLTRPPGGMCGHDGGQAAAWHVPNGVAIFGLIVWNASLLARYGRDAGAI